MGTCSVVLGLGSEWTRMGQKMIQGHWNKVEYPLSSVVKGLGLGWTQMGWETVQRHQNEVECPLTIPHAFQQHLSAEKTPTLCNTIPSFEAMVQV